MTQRNISTMIYPVLVQFRMYKAVPLLLASDGLKKL